MNKGNRRPETRTGAEGAQRVGSREALKGLAALAVVPFIPEAGRGEQQSPGSSDRDRGAAPLGRDRRLDDGWRFYRGDAPGAERPDFDDSAWRALDLPHSAAKRRPGHEAMGSAALINRHQMYPVG